MQLSLLFFPPPLSRMHDCVSAYVRACMCVCPTVGRHLFQSEVSCVTLSKKIIEFPIIEALPSA